MTASAEFRLRRLLSEARRLADSKSHDGALILAFSLVDTLGLINAPASKVDAGSSTFCAWLDEYLLPLPGETVTSDDLWGARCGIVHALTQESRHARAGRARLVIWRRDLTSGPRDPSWSRHLELAIQNVPSIVRYPWNASQICVVSLEGFLDALAVGLDRFLEHLETDQVLQESMSHRLHASLTVLTITDSYL
ncbi:MAG: hypothetical protein ACK5ZS_01715 [bacterium]|jgi:hypothetical protein